MVGTFSWKKQIRSYGLLTVGTFFMALGINGIYEPMAMVTGGFSGVGILLHHLWKVPLWVTTLLLNIPVYAAAYKKIGRRYVGKSLYATLSLSAFLAIIPGFPVQNEDYLMAALLGGILNGVGLGIVFGEGASTGGTDLLSVLLNPIFARMSSAGLLGIIDGLIVAFGMLFFGVRLGIYSIVAVAVTSRVMDRIMEGMKFAKLLLIISDQPEKMAEGILNRLQRGVTSLEGCGMYSGAKRHVLLCAVSRKEAVQVVQIVRETDEKAFVILTDAREILGEGFSDF